MRLRLLTQSFIVLPVIQANLDSLKQNLRNQICSDHANPDVYCATHHPFDSDCVNKFDGIRLAEFCDQDVATARKRKRRNAVEAAMLAYVQTWTQNLFNSITNYGCWCYFDDNLDKYEKGKGAALEGNGVDAGCKAYAHGIYSIKQDNAEEGGSCTDPLNTSYISASDRIVEIQSADVNITTFDAVIQACDELNDSSTNLCENRVCKVEQYFSAGVFDFFLGSGNLNTTVQHSNGWDPDTYCHTGAGSNRPGKIASTGSVTGFTTCGTYPTRKRYRTSDDFEKSGVAVTKSCCGNHYTFSDRSCCDNLSTYDSSIQVCCGDGEGTVKKTVEECDN